MDNPVTGRTFWTDECADPIAAINFALDELDTFDAVEFLISWREGDVEEWPEFIEKVTKK